MGGHEHWDGAWSKLAGAAPPPLPVPPARQFSTATDFHPANSLNYCFRRRRSGL